MGPNCTITQSSIRHGRTSHWLFADTHQKRVFGQNNAFEGMSPPTKTTIRLHNTCHFRRIKCMAHITKCWVDALPYRSFLWISVSAWCSSSCYSFPPLLLGWVGKIAEWYYEHEVAPRFCLFKSTESKSSTILERSSQWVIWRFLFRVWWSSSERPYELSCWMLWWTFCYGWKKLPLLLKCSANPLL